MGPLTWLTVALLALFGVVDAVAHFTRYRYGRTFSAAVWWLEKRIPILRVVVGALCLLLFTHLTFQLP